MTKDTKPSPTVSPVRYFSQEMHQLLLAIILYWEAGVMLLNWLPKLVIYYSVMCESDIRTRHRSPVGGDVLSTLTDVVDIPDDELFDL